MPTTIAKGGFGTTVWRDDGTGAFTKIAEIGDVSGPAISQVLVDATHQESPNGAAEKIGVGVHELGDVTFTMHLLQDDATQAALVADVRTKTKRNFRVVLPSGTKRWAFAAYVANVGAAYPMRDKMVRDVAISITGDAVFEAHP